MRNSLYREDTDIDADEDCAPLGLITDSARLRKDGRSKEIVSRSTVGCIGEEGRSHSICREGSSNGRVLGCYGKIRTANKRSFMGGDPHEGHAEMREQKN